MSAEGGASRTGDLAVQASSPKATWNPFLCLKTVCGGSGGGWRLRESSLSVGLFLCPISYWLKSFPGLFHFSVFLSSVLWPL